MVILHWKQAKTCDKKSVFTKVCWIDCNFTVFIFQMWERGIELCQEIAKLYEQELFDYEKLSWILVCFFALYSS